MSGTVGKMTWGVCNTCIHYNPRHGCDVPDDDENIRRDGDCVECYDYVEVIT